MYIYLMQITKSIKAIHFILSSHMILLSFTLTRRLFLCPYELHRQLRRGLESSQSHRPQGARNVHYGHDRHRPRHVGVYLHYPGPHQTGHFAISRYVQDSILVHYMSGGW
jgi:hypothetical protein